MKAMSNEPKWVITRERDEDGNKEYILTDGHVKFFFEDRVPPYGVLLTLNRLESENAELRERLEAIDEGFGSVETGNSSEHVMDAARYTTPRTDAVIELPILKDCKPLDGIALEILNKTSSRLLRESVKPLTDADELKQMCEKLIGYAEHDTDCKVNGIGEVRCNCGLTELIQQFRTTQSATEGEQNG